MNKEYTYIGEKVIIENENGEKRVIENSDNLEQILVEENLIEKMEERLIEINDEIQNNSDIIKSLKNWRFAPLLTMILFTCLIPTITNLLIGDMSSQPFGHPNSAFVAMFGNMSISTVLTIYFGRASTLLGSVISLTECSKYKEAKRKARGLTTEKQKLQNALEEEIIKLNTLKETTKNISEQKELTVKKVDDKELLEGLKAYLQLYYDCGYNEDTYSKYYMNGTLQKKLKRYGYTEVGIDEIESYLEQKEPTLVKKLTPPKNNKNK